MLRSSLLAALGLFAGALAHAAQPSLPFDVPYSPSAAVAEIPVTLGSWSEVYQLDSAPEAALQALVVSGNTPAPLAVAGQEVLHFSVKGRHLSLPETSVTLMRAGAPVAYADDCSVLPAKGDTMTLTYEASRQGQVTLELEMMEHFAFGRPNDLAVVSSRLDLSDKSQCDRVEESRMVFKGKLSVRFEGQGARAIPVLVQTVVLN